jgi:hypothetical protein
MLSCWCFIRVFLSSPTAHKIWSICTAMASSWQDDANASHMGKMPICYFLWTIKRFISIQKSRYNERQHSILTLIIHSYLFDRSTGLISITQFDSSPTDPVPLTCIHTGSASYIRDAVRNLHSRYSAARCFSQAQLGGPKIKYLDCNAAQKESTKEAVAESKHMFSRAAKILG